MDCHSDSFRLSGKYLRHCWRLQARYWWAKEEHSHYLLPSDLLARLGGHNFGDLSPYTDHLLLNLLLRLLRYVWNTAQGTDNVETAHCSSLEKMLGQHQYFEVGAKKNKVGKFSMDNSWVESFCLI